jgi:plastocyanin
MRLNAGRAAVLLAAVACGGGGGGSEPPPPVATLSVSPPQPDSLFSRGATVQLTVVARDANNATINNPTLSFNTGNQNVATVSNTGLVTAQGNGETNITVQSGSVSASVPIRVRRRVVTVAVNPPSRTLVPGGMQTFTASAVDANSNSISGFTATFTSNNAAVEITAGGEATAKSIGSATITATMSTPDGTKTGLASVTVQQIPATATINLLLSSFSPTSVDITANGSVTFVNASGQTHNVTFTATSITDIPDHGSGQNVRVFTQAGNFDFVCTLHPGMQGIVIVH